MFRNFASIFPYFPPLPTPVWKLASVLYHKQTKPCVYPCGPMVSGVGFKLEHPEADTFQNLETLCKKLFRSTSLKRSTIDLQN